MAGEKSDMKENETRAEKDNTGGEERMLQEVLKKGRGTKRASSFVLLTLLFISFCRTILEKEGMRSLFRGLGPNLVGVAPSR